MQRFFGRGIVPWDQYFSFKAVFQKFTQARLVLIPEKICDGRCASPWRDKARLTAYVDLLLVVADRGRVTPDTIGQAHTGGAGL